MTARAGAQPAARRSAHTAVHTDAHAAVHTTGRRFARAADGAGGADWQASSYSNAEGGNCVEVAHSAGGDGVVPVRDGKRPRGPALVFEPGAWSSFLEVLKGPERHAEAP